MIRAIGWYARWIRVRTCSTPVHHASDPDIIAGIVVVLVKWCMALDVTPLYLVICVRKSAACQVVASTAAARVLRLSLWSIYTRRDLMHSCRGTLSPYCVTRVWLPSLRSQLLYRIICISSSLFGANRMFRISALLMLESSPCCSVHTEPFWLFDFCAMTSSSRYEVACRR